MAAEILICCNYNCITSMDPSAGADLFPIWPLIRSRGSKRVMPEIKQEEELTRARLCGRGRPRAGKRRWCWACCASASWRSELSQRGGFTPWTKRREKEGGGVAWMVVGSSRDGAQRRDNVLGHRGDASNARTVPKFGTGLRHIGSNIIITIAAPACSVAAPVALAARRGPFFMRGS